MDRLNIYLSFFNQLGYNHNAILTPPELLSALETLSGTPYNEDIASQLLERIQNSSNSFILSDFIQVLIEAEDILSDKVSKSSNLIAEYSNQRVLFEQKLHAIKTNESYNPLGVNLENNLMIEIHEISGIPKLDTQFYMILNCGAQKFKSQRFHAIGTQHRINEIFNGKIEHGTENIHMKMMALRPNGEETTLGLQMINISEVSDQLKHDFALPLMADNGFESTIRVSLSIQWIHSKVSYYEQIIQKLNNEIEALSNDQKDYQLDLEWLVLPFKKNANYQRTPVYNYTSNQPLQIHVPDSLLISQGKEGNFMAPNQGMGVDTGLKRSKILKQENELKESPFSHHNKEIHNKDLRKDYLLIGTLILTSFYGIFAILSCFMRTNFLDLFICFSLLSILVSNFFERWKLKTLIFLMIFSIFVDMPWLIIYTNNWWDETYYIERNSDEKGILRLSVVMSYFTLVSKIFLTWFYWKLGGKVDKMNDKLTFFFKPTEIMK